MFYRCFTNSPPPFFSCTFLFRIINGKIPIIKYEHKKTTLTLHSEGQTAVSIEKNTAHSRNPLLDKLEIIAEAIGGLLEGKSSFSQSELRSLAHIRQMTRMHKTKSREQ